MLTPQPASKFRRMRLMQEEAQWNIETDLPWGGIDPRRPLLPGCEALAGELGLSGDETLVFSQLLGLMAVQGISQHEKILGVVKEECWRRPLGQRAAAADLVELGEQFFLEEEKHSRAFARYVRTFAEASGLGLRDLESILPVYDRGAWTTRLFRLNCRLGGRAIWWLVMITEEESLALFRQLKDHAAVVDPLFFELNRQHFQEEIRHMSYAPLMVRTLGAETPFGRRSLLRLDYLTAEALHIVWLVKQMRRLRRVRSLAAKHPFFETLAGALAKFDALPLNGRVELLLTRIPFASDAMNPRRHASLRVETRRNSQVAVDLVQKLLAWACARIGAV